ncbi:MAG: FAD binding domain-containing protein [Rhodococcus sp. (in: high G+C Gram-positive bacteria)]|uniref:FAD binding domain-containing protein n=1 Tax=Rhodococcus sp. TaxID=1831 RepID=UPI002ADCB3B7|nr:FAD binding domain-containing protein [Rhodococcus sp. (in: high G+C Gram-positive bacteria)]
MRALANGSGIVAQSQSAIAPFRLYRPESITEVTAILAAEPNAVIGAGCTDLVAKIREGCAPEALVALQKVAGLKAITYDDDILRLGAMVTHHDGATSPIVAGAVPGLAAAWATIATVRIRYSATVGGNLMARRHRYEMPLILGALDAQLSLSDGNTVAVDELWSNDTTALLTEIAIPTSVLVWFGYSRSMRPTITVALAVRRGADGTLEVHATAGSEYRQGFSLRVDTGATSMAELDPASTAVALGAQLPDAAADFAGSAEYRRHLVTVLTRRLLTSATGTNHHDEDGTHA